MIYDKIIIGTGLYGLYAADFCSAKDQQVLILECDSKPCSRATYINQARVHSGYHYPRSVSTAVKSINYFEKFNDTYSFCINKNFEQIYAISSNYSWTSAADFKKFCSNVGIDCLEIPVEKYFKKGLCEAAFLTKEYTYDANILCNYFTNRFDQLSQVEIKYNIQIENIQITENNYIIITNQGTFYTPFLLNATYASINQIIKKFNNSSFKFFNIKYELCEIILCKINEDFKKVGLTVMDGPFFSIMPFGKSGLHSLTSVTFTPHLTSYGILPKFKCQENNNFCSPNFLGNCNLCKNKPETAWNYMFQLYKKYVSDKIKISYIDSLFSMKPILKSAEIDDSRPTAIKVYSEKPYFISVLSGKINTIFDLDEYLIL